MKAIAKYILAALAITALTAPEAAAQNDGSQSSTVSRRSGSDRRSKDKDKSGNPEITQRMEAFYEDTPTSEADLQWMRVIYRQLDLNDDQNAPLYFPEEPIEGQENLFRIIMRLLANNQVPAYEYLDGRELFTPEYQIKVRDMLDRFHVLYTPAKGSTEKNPKFVIEEADVPANEVLSYYVLERWEFDSRTNRMKTRVEAICPVLHRSGDFGGEAVKYPMFWIKMDALRPYLAQQYIFTSDDNNLATATYDDYFAMNMYKGDIYKTRNLKNKSMMQLYPDPDDLKRAQDSIQNRLDSFEKKLWVPDREEIIAAREAREAAAAGDTLAIASRDDAAAEKTVKSTRSTRAKKKSTPKKSTVKESKASSSSSAVRSVRRRK
ncbi:MAG: gliding motility protein GldN [Bacteroidales bacterium]|nr:gliding motility protein GldN [Bacteroidales bacterium]